MSRVSDILERLEAAARRLSMSIEDAVLILEGKHPDHEIHKTVTIEVPIVTVPAPVVPVATPEAPTPVVTPPETPNEAVQSGAQLELIQPITPAPIQGVED